MGRDISGYNTRQGEAVLAFLRARPQEYITAAQISEHLSRAGDGVGRTTVYRQLYKLAKSGAVRRFVADGVAGARWKYVPEERRARGGVHLKCDICGGIVDLRCDTVSVISKHIFERHEFRIDDAKTVFYGKCGKCMREENRG
ncbi:MAG: transcriptional repressor [Oscillospiraceae bacterium]|nr:transcriptional repressor [Oscillospiraceae bacterium]